MEMLYIIPLHLTYSIAAKLYLFTHKARITIFLRYHNNIGQL